jgi:hypothetical protein
MKPDSRDIHFDEDGHLNEEGVALYVDGLRLERTKRLPEAIQAHVADCQQCRISVTDLYVLLEGDQVEQAHPTLHKPTGQWSLIFRVAAMVTVTVGIAAIVYFFTRPSPEVPSSSGATITLAGPDSALHPVTPEKQPHAGAKESIAANYDALPELESLVGGGTRGEAFESLSPASWPHGSDIYLRWKTTGPGPWTIVLVDNLGKNLKEARADRAELRLAGPFRPGLYYWKVLQNGELMYVGKFRVEK